MSIGPRKPGSTTGVLHIVRQDPSRTMPASVFLLSFGGMKDKVGAFYVGRASGLDALAAVLVNFGVSQDDVDSAIQVLTAQPHHQIPNVTITEEFLRSLGS